MSKNKKLGLITGASSGIGKAFCELLAKEKYNLVLVARRKTLLEELAHTLEKQSKINVKIISTDLTKEKDLKQVINFISKNFIDLLINNAGFGTHYEFASGNLKKELEMIDLHCKATLQLIFACLPEMKKRKQGEIINVSSGAAFLPMPYMATYAATKSFILHFGIALAEELKPYKIKVLTLCPGMTKTEFQEVQNLKISHFKKLRAMTPYAVAKTCLADLKKNKILSIPGIENKSLYYLTKFFPYNLKLPLATLVLKPQNEK